MSSRFPRALDQLRGLSPVERRSLLLAAAVLPLAWLALRLLGLQKAQSYAGGATMRPGTMDPNQMRRIAALVNAAARRSLFPVTCLTRSLVLEWLLRRQGVESELRIGVRYARGQLDAHAWIECDGEPVNDIAHIRNEFAVFDQPIPAHAFKHP